MIKKFICYAVLLFINFHASAISMEESCPLPAQEPCVASTKSNLEMSQELGQWFVNKYSSDYQGHFKGTYYSVNSCRCGECSSNHNKTHLFVQGLREGDPDADISHYGKPSKSLGEGDQYRQFVYSKEWQYLKEDMIAVCLDPNVENMVKFSGMPFIQLVSREEAKNVEDHLSSILKGCTYHKTKPFPEDWQFSFSVPFIERKDTAFNLFSLLGNLKKLTESGSYTYKFMSSALVVLRQLAEEVDKPTKDITVFHQEFFADLVKFQLWARDESSETKQLKIDFVLKALSLYKGIMSRNPVRALKYRGKINQSEIKHLLTNLDEKKNLEFSQLLNTMNAQIDCAKINLSLFANATGKDHMMKELEILKDFFKDGLQQKYNLAQVIKQAFLD